MDAEQPLRQDNEARINDGGAGSRNGEQGPLVATTPTASLASTRFLKAAVLYSHSLECRAQGLGSDGELLPDADAVRSPCLAPPILPRWR